ncbi:unnamed protein product [Medioppia subpectinata]|uniref:NR LBD domain-containing protein n=1 Tax=Medioppia subpectinata TaxID=1979941 RepID=A0A7R9L013_9ACAR|nr:unnamed protein product [Medioppia subpectinata]CAG2113096.1 unnamed protein product [Medioppia subpectinata]
MCKSLTSFARIEETDRILLIKHGFLDLKLIRSLKYYDYKQGGWAMNMEDGNTKVVSIESTKLLPNNAYIFYRQFFNDISQEWESDPIILDLLTAIILFNPDRPKLVNSTMIKFQQHKYMYLLQRYLLMRYKYHDMMRSKFTKLIQYATDVAILTQINQHIFKNVGPQHDPGNHVHFIITHVGGHKGHQPFGQPVIGVNPILLTRIGGQVWPRNGNGVLNK